MSQNNKKRNILTKIAKELNTIVETMLISFFIVSMVFTYFFKVATVKGSSMENTLMPKDRIIALSIYPDIKRGDIVIINAQDAVMLDENGNPSAKSGLGK